MTGPAIPPPWGKNARVEAVMRAVFNWRHATVLSEATRAGVPFNPDSEAMWATLVRESTAGDELACHAVADFLECVNGILEALDALLPPIPTHVDVRYTTAVADMSAKETSARLRAAMQALELQFPGFACLLLVFSRGNLGEGKDGTAYISNAQRGDMVKALREFLTKVEPVT